MYEEKPDCDPLFPEGFHTIDMIKLRIVCVDSKQFAKSETRNDIMVEFETLVQSLVEAEVPCEIWANGSFLTKAENPKDIDISIHFDAEMYDLDPKKQAALNRVQDIFDNSMIDGYLAARWPAEHPSHGLSEVYWKKQWGFSRSGRPKGIAVIQLCGGVP